MTDVVLGRHVLIIGHADGDGYLAAETSRRNVINAGAKSCNVLVDPRITPGYRFWEKHLYKLDFGHAETVIFVDLMLNHRDPLDSFSRIVSCAKCNRDRQFILIDHHPRLFTELPPPPTNLSLRPVKTVFECCFGDPEREAELMLVGSICDRDQAPVQDRLTKTHRLRAIGVSRAAADRAMLAGEPLVKLLQDGRWDILEMLGHEDPSQHRTVRGTRPKNDPRTPAIIEAAKAAV